MTQITINRGDKVSIPFVITDAANGLAGKRVTWSIAAAANSAVVLQKIGGLPGSTADVTITSQTAGQITGNINILTSDYATLSADSYVASLWIDDGAGTQRCVTDGGVDQLKIVRDVSRT